MSYFTPKSRSNGLSFIKPYHTIPFNMSKHRRRLLIWLNIQIYEYAYLDK